MEDQLTILLVEDEPLILMDLEYAAEDAGVQTLSAAGVDEALGHIASGTIDVAVLDVSLRAGENCVPIARELDQRRIPYVIHSGDLDRQNEIIRSLAAQRIAKPACSSRVIAAALELLDSPEGYRRAG